ncbi:MAG: amidohydrolase [Firmicutes bacterium]|nr:amidohydrolase [Bacillota bacterium]
MEEMKYIDAHCHIGNHLEFSLTPEELLDFMERFSIDHSIICPMGSEIILDVRGANERIGKLVNLYPDKFTGFGCTNPWYASAVDEIEYAISVLKLQGIYLEPSLQGFPVNHELVYPIMEKIAQLNVPLYVHTGTPPYALPLQVADLAERFPEINIIMGSIHSDFWFDVLPAAEKASNLYVDASCVFVETALAEIIDRCGIERVLFATDFPYYNPYMVFSRFSLLKLSKEGKESLFHANIERLVRIGGGMA